VEHTPERLLEGAPEALLKPFYSPSRTAGDKALKDQEMLISGDAAADIRLAPCQAWAAGFACRVAGRDHG
jgi:hypothetical protein